MVTLYPEAPSWFLLDIVIYFKVKHSLLLKLWVCCVIHLIHDLPSSLGPNTNSVGALVLGSLGFS